MIIMFPLKTRSYCDWKIKNENHWRITKNYEAKCRACLHEKGLK